MSRWLLVPLVLVAGTVAWLWSLLFGGNLHPVAGAEIWRSGKPGIVRLNRWIDELPLASVLSLSRPDHAEALLVTGRGLPYLQHEMYSGKMPSPADLVLLIDAIDAMPRPLLVHCAGGSERSGLAGAVVRLLQDEPPEAARDEFRVRTGFIASESDLPRVIDDYAAWLEMRGVEHEPDVFRRWAATDYVPEFYRARIELEPLPDVAAGEPFTVRLRVTNESYRPWSFGAGEKGVHVYVHLSGPGFDAGTRTGWIDHVLDPGASIDLEAELPAPDVPGVYVLSTECVNEHVDWFRDFGSPPVEVDLVVR